MVNNRPEWRRRDAEYKELRREARRAPAFHHQVWSQEDVRQERKVHYQAEVVDPEARAAVGPKTTTSWASRTRETDDSDFEPGLMVRLTKLDPSTTKATISAFVCYSVDQYLRKKAEKQKKGNEGKDNVIDIQSIKINYVDYEKGLGEAYTRQSTREDSELIVDALRKRKKNMRDGEDTKGKKTVKSDEKGWVEGKVLVGEEEQIYWQKLLLAKNIKGRGKGVKGLKGEKFVTSNFSPDTKRTRKESIPQANKRIKFSE